MTWDAYEAMVIREKISGKNLPTVADVIVDTLTQNDILKREELVYQVSKVTGIDQSDVNKRVDAVLMYLNRHGKVSRAKVGYWCIRH